MKTVEWFFDFVSPYSYFQCEILHRLPQTVQLEYKPVLFAGLLNHWGQKGPVEIDAKRKLTFRSCIWIARKHNIPLTFPRAHPFNPLPLLRLSIALDNRPDVVRDLFRFVFREGKLPDEPEAWSHLIHQLNVPNADELIQSSEVKQRLHDNTDYAIAKGVFGVPSFRVDGEIFWGVDLFDFFLDYLDDPDLFKDPEMQRVENLPVASARRS
ncbi:MAG: 2-hydroxychromene-2-carboxylate isomerase [Arenicellales bacterium]|nr:2-hydroxychromene-2-carboxylate isomerase [Arenicellales bacterium]